MTRAWPLLLWLQAAAPVSGATVTAATLPARSATPQPDDEEIIGNLELLEDWDMLSRLGVLDDMDVVGDEDEGEKP